MTTKRVRGGRDDLLARVRAPAALDQPRPGGDLVGAVDRDVELVERLERLHREPGARAATTVAGDVATQRRRSPRAASSASSGATVVPVPRPTRMPSSTRPAAYPAASRFSASCVIGRSSRLRASARHAAAMPAALDPDEQRLVDSIAARSDELVALLCDLIAFDTTSRDDPAAPARDEAALQAASGGAAARRRRRGRRVGAGAARTSPAIRSRRRAGSASRGGRSSRRASAARAAAGRCCSTATSTSCRRGARTAGTQRPVRAAGARRARRRPRRVRHEGRDRRDGRRGGGASPRPAGSPATWSSARTPTRSRAASAGWPARATASPPTSRSCTEPSSLEVWPACRGSVYCSVERARALRPHRAGAPELARRRRGERDRQGAAPARRRRPAARGVAQPAQRAPSAARPARHRREPARRRLGLARHDPRPRRAHARRADPPRPGRRRRLDARRAGGGRGVPARAGATPIPGWRASAAVRLAHGGQPVRDAGDAASVRALLAANEALGLPTTLGGLGSWYDGATFALEAGTPALMYGPSSIDRAHTVGEWVPVADLVAARRASRSPPGGSAARRCGGAARARASRGRTRPAAGARRPPRAGTTRTGGTRACRPGRARAARRRRARGRGRRARWRPRRRSSPVAAWISSGGRPVRSASSGLTQRVVARDGRRGRRRRTGALRSPRGRVSRSRSTQGHINTAPPGMRQLRVA